MNVQVMFHDDQEVVDKCRRGVWMVEPDNNIITDPPALLTMALAASGSTDEEKECVKITSNIHKLTMKEHFICIFTSA